MLSYYVLAGGEIDAEDLVAGNEAVLPLNAATQLLDRAVRRACGAAQFDDRHASDPGYVAFDQVSAHGCHGSPPFDGIICGGVADAKLKFLAKYKDNL
jgi:hypothetical protein